MQRQTSSIQGGDVGEGSGCAVGVLEVHQIAVVVYGCDQALDGVPLGLLGGGLVPGGHLGIASLFSNLGPSCRLFGFLLPNLRR